LSAAPTPTSTSLIVVVVKTQKRQPAGVGRRPAVISIAKQVLIVVVVIVVVSAEKGPPLAIELDAAVLAVLVCLAGASRA
jgi:hypothetical protein